MTTPYHFPSELFELLVETIPRLVRSKRAVLELFWASGMNRSVTEDIESQLRTDRESISKFYIVRNLLTALNEAGDPALGERRELLKRVCEFEAFSTCWPEDQLKAKGLVAEVRDQVERHDFFRRLQRQRDSELREHRQKEREKSDGIRQRNEDLTNLRHDFYALFGLADPHQRGKELETILGRFFSAHEILVREPFALVDEFSGKINEQIDGVVEIDGHLYLVEMKWLKDPVDVVDMSRHINRVLTRVDCRGIFISYSGYTSSAVSACKEAMRDAPIILCTLEEFVMLMEHSGDVQDFLREKVRALIVDKNPYRKMVS